MPEVVCTMSLFKTLLIALEPNHYLFYIYISGLALFVSRNGEAVVGANMLPTDSFERVHISSDVGSPLSNG